MQLISALARKFEPAIPEAATAPSHVEAFVLWLLEHRNDTDVPPLTGMRWTRLRNLYYEFCWLKDTKPLGDITLKAALRSAGVTAYRVPTKILKGRLYRPTLYKLAAVEKAHNKPKGNRHRVHP